MISKISIENYRGINNSREISFAANPRRKADKSGITKVGGKETLLSVALMGKNASGKSSFIDGIDFINELASGVLYKNVLYHLENVYRRKNKKTEVKKINNKIDIKFKSIMNFILKEEFNNLSKPIKLFIEFIDSKNIIGLSIELSTDGMVTEKITKNNKIYSKQKKNIVSFVSNIFSKELNFKRIKFLSEFSILNEIFISNINWTKLFKNKKINKDLVFQWIRISDNKIKKIIWTSNNEIERFIIGHEDIEKIISFNELSTGTRKWLSISHELLKALYINQSFIFIDELDKSLHPFLVNFIIILINDLKINKKRSQLLFTSHSPLTVEKPFRKDAINYIDKYGKVINLGRQGMREDLSITKNFLSEKLSSHPIKSDIFEFLSDLHE